MIKKQVSFKERNFIWDYIKVQKTLNLTDDLSEGKKGLSNHHLNEWTNAKVHLHFRLRPQPLGRPRNFLHQQILVLCGAVWVHGCKWSCELLLFDPKIFIRFNGIPSVNIIKGGNSRPPTFSTRILSWYWQVFIILLYYLFVPPYCLNKSSNILKRHFSTFAAELRRKSIFHVHSTGYEHLIAPFEPPGWFITLPISIIELLKGQLF